MFKRHEVLDIIMNHLSNVNLSIDLDKNSDLNALGLLDSLASVEINHLIENKFNIKISESSFTYDTLYSVNTITDLVMKNIPFESEI